MNKQKLFAVDRKKKTFDHFFKKFFFTSNEKTNVINACKNQCIC